MEKRNESVCRERRQGAVQEEQQSSSSKVARNEDPVEGTMKLDRMSKDASVLFSHIPEEIWLLITDKVVDSETLTNLMRASPVFRNLLLPRRIEFLFPQVWQVLGWKFENEKDEVYRRKNSCIDQRNKILTLRKVCKSWCTGVDEFYENLPEHIRMNKYSPNGDWSILDVGIWMHNRDFIGSPEDVEEFMNHFDQTHFYDDGNQRNPIINRSILISFETNYDREGGILILLEKYGHHFWHCGLYISNFFTSWITFYTELTRLLELLPNLKTLEVCYGDINRGWDEQGSKWVDRGTLPTEMEILQLEQEIASRPLPKLHQLKYLLLFYFPSWLFNALVSANNHISMLHVERNDVHQGYDIHRLPMPNLKQLSMTYFSRAEFENLNTPEANWSLEKIDLDLRCCDYIPRSQIFSLLEDKWADTLINVAILTPSTTGPSDDINVTDDGSSKTLNLPKVERFIFSTQEISNLDFIMPMKSLKVLRVALPNETQFNEATVKLLHLIQKNQVVQFVGYFQGFHKSNIWDLFPNLKSLELGNADDNFTSFRVTCTREHYEKSANERNKNLWFSESA